jgi:SPP1 gp7 family putative phage head morphogenesis protein
MSTFSATPLPHDEAAAAIAGKSIVTRSVFNKLLPELQEAAFTVSGVECFETLQRVRDAIAAVPQGADWDKAKETIAAELEPYLDNEEASLRRAELLLRLHVFRAYAATNFRLMEAHRDTFPYRQYIATNDTNVRDTHAALHGKVFPSTSPFWETHTGPWEWGCRCEAVPLLPHEAADMLTEDKAKQLPPEAWRVVPEAILDRLQQIGEIHVGPHEQGGIQKKQGVYDVRTPREKTGDPDAFEWRPGEIAMPLETVRKRYTPDVWLLWEAWARSTKLPDGRALWDALNRTPTPAPPPSPTPKPASKRKPKTPAPTATATATATTALIPAGGAAVSASFPAKLSTKIADAAALIDSVHGDGTLRAMRVRMLKGKTGEYFPSSGYIDVGKSGISPLAQFVHELGHKLDWEGIGTPAKPGHETPEMAEFLRAAKASKAYAGLQDDYLAKWLAWPAQTSFRSLDKYLKYQKEDYELWARAYMQFIAIETGHPELQQRVADTLKGATGYWKNSQWTSEDFAPVHEAMRAVFVSKGWMTGPQPPPTSTPTA